MPRPVPSPAPTHQAGVDERLESISPFPVVYLQGTVTLDGAPVAEGEIVVRVGDWERPTRIPVVDGHFDCASVQGCLLVGPPGYITEDPLRYVYVGEPVTFHLNGEQQADLTYPFAHMAEPCFVGSVELRFGAGAEPRVDQPCPGAPAPDAIVAPPPTPTATPTPTPTPVITNVPGSRDFRDMLADGLRASGLGRVITPNSQDNDAHVLGWGLGNDTAVIRIQIGAVFTQVETLAHSRMRGDAASEIVLETLGLDSATAKKLVDTANAIAEAEKSPIGCRYSNVLLSAFPEGFEGIAYIFRIEVIPEPPDSTVGRSGCLAWPIPTVSTS